jgi:hypothetical protein
MDDRFYYDLRDPWITVIPVSRLTDYLRHKLWLVGGNAGKVPAFRPPRRPFYAIQV